MPTISQLLETLPYGPALEAAAPGLVARTLRLGVSAAADSSEDA